MYTTASGENPVVGRSGQYNDVYGHTATAEAAAATTSSGIVINLIVIHEQPNINKQVNSSMYVYVCTGLERFGDYLMKMSNSNHPNKHVSIAKQYCFNELLCFLAVHDPSLYRPPIAAFAQSHMFCVAQLASPSSWEVSGTRNREVHLLPLVVVDQLAALYRTQNLGVSSEFTDDQMSRTALQVTGSLWNGLRYVRMYCEGYSQGTLGQGICCLSLPSPAKHPLSYDGRLFGIVRNILWHKYVLNTRCPRVYFFEVELLQVGSSTTDVPLMEAKVTGQRMWFSQASFDRFNASQQFCLRDHDDPDVSQFYLIQLS